MYGPGLRLPQNTCAWPVDFLLEKSETTRWSTTHSSKVNLHTAIDVRALCGAHLVTLPRKFWSKFWSWVSLRGRPTASSFRQLTAYPANCRLIHPIAAVSINQPSQGAQTPNSVQAKNVEFRRPWQSLHQKNRRIATSFLGCVKVKQRPENLRCGVEVRVAFCEGW